MASSQASSKLYFAGADLSDADLRGADFSLANVTKVICSIKLPILDCYLLLFFFLFHSSYIFFYSFFYFVFIFLFFIFYVVLSYFVYYMLVMILERSKKLPSFE